MVKNVILITIVVIIIAGAWWSGRDEVPKAIISDRFASPTKTRPTVIPSITDEAAETPTETKDLEIIKIVFAENHGVMSDEVQVTISQRDETHVKGVVSFAPYDPPSTGNFLAVKKGDSWTIDYEGNGIVDCELVRADGFPADMLPVECK